MRAKRTPSPEINMIALINIIFLILIFFILAGQMTKPQPFSITPPLSDSALSYEGGGQRGRVEIFLSADGMIALGLDQGDIATLIGRLGQLDVQSREQVHIFADARAEAGAVVDILTALKEADVVSIRLSVREPDG